MEPQKGTKGTKRIKKAVAFFYQPFVPFFG